MKAGRFIKQNDYDRRQSVSKANIKRFHTKKEQLHKEFDAEPSISAAVDDHRNSIHSTSPTTSTSTANDIGSGRRSQKQHPLYKPYY